MSAILPPAQRGAHAVEYALGSLLFFGLSIAAIESTHWLLVKQTLNHVLLDTARLAATTGAQPQLIDTLFQYHLQSLPTFQLQSSEKSWQIKRINPPAANKAVRFSYQNLQYTQGNQRIYQDNSLHLRLTYAHKPLSPFISKLLQTLAATASPENYSYFQAGVVAIHTEIHVAMQSDQRQNALFAWTAKEKQTHNAHIPILPLKTPPTTDTPFSIWKPSQTSPLDTLTNVCHAQQCCSRD